MRITLARPHRLVMSAIASLVVSPVAIAQVHVIGTYYRGDRDFPAFHRLWSEDPDAPEEAQQPDGGDDAGDAHSQAVPRTTPAHATTKPTDGGETRLGASLHVFVKNGGRRAVTIDDVSLGGLPMSENLAYSAQRKRKKFASIYFSKLSDAQKARLIDLGEPVWWKADPREISPGCLGEVVVRLRHPPKDSAVPISIKQTGGQVDAQVSVARDAPRVAGVSFAPGFKEAYLYFRHAGGHGIAPVRIAIDGEDVTDRCTVARDETIALTPAIVRLARPVTAGSFHTFTGTYKDGSVAMAGQRAWAEEFVCGMFGGRPGKDGDVEAGREYVDDLLRHNINVQMPQIGSPPATAFYKDPAGRQYLTAHGFRMVLPDPGKFGVQDPYALYVHDEPDCGDFKAEGLPENKKIGALAQWVISHADELRQSAPALAQMLNVNMTYKPHCWYVYGQIPDILAVDPYYQVRLRGAYWDRPERIPLYSKATYIYAVAATAESAAEPKPLHVILYANRYLDKAKQLAFRFPTPAEKRIEAYYAVAGGAKGLSYWWYTPSAKAFGVGAASSPRPDTEAAALWREIGLVGAELRTAGPVIATSCPIDVKAQAPDNVWLRFLASGDDTLILLAVNDQYENTDKGTTIRPVNDVTVAVDLPAWMKKAQAFEVSPAGTRNVASRQTATGLQLTLGDLDVTRMIVMTTDPRLRGRLQAGYASRLAAGTMTLLKERGK